MKRMFFLILCLMMLMAPGVLWAEEVPVEAAAAAIDTGDTAFIMLCAALVLLMTPGLAFFYGGMVRRKNVLSTMMHSFIAMAVASVLWVLVGYSLAFGTDVGGIVGGLEYFGFEGVGQDPLDGSTIPHIVFASFQMMFAIITVALISGAFAERMRFPAFLLFTSLWLLVVYSPLCHWVWGGGWIMKSGALDFAGGTVVHISSGVSGLVAALVLGKRKGLGVEPMPPHSLPLTVLGAGLLWFGWFGFNAGSALAANGLAGSAFLVTNTAAATAALAWIVAEWLSHGKPTILGACSGAVAGLVAITPAAGFVTPMSAIIIGLVVGIICYYAVILKSKLGYDDSLDAFGIHGVGGTWGAIATGLFATTMVNEAGNDGLFYGNAELVVTQIVAVIATMIFAAVATYVILKVVNFITPIRAEVKEEELGMDATQHGESAYSI